MAGILKDRLAIATVCASWRKVADEFGVAVELDQYCQAENMDDKDVAAIITLPEESRRMQDMMKMYGMGGADDEMFGETRTLVLNTAHPLVRFVLEHKRAQSVPVICRQLYDLAMISHRALTQEEMHAFVKRSNEIMMLLTK